MEDRIMTEENKEPVGGEETVSTPPEGNPEKTETKEPEKTGDASLQEKLDIITRQYNESSKEALRLKEVTESLQAKLDEKEQTSSIQDLQESVDPDILKVFETMLDSKLKPLQEKVGGFEQKETEQVLNTFINEHPGLKNEEALNSFNEELGKLKGIYSPNEAMEKAWILCNGKELDSKASNQVVDDTVQTEKQKQELLKQAGGAEIIGGSVPQRSELEIKTQKAYDLALSASHRGDPGQVDLWINYNTLRAQLDSLQNKG